MYKLKIHKYRYIILLPIVINFIINIFDYQSVIPLKNLNLYNLLATALLFFTLVQIGLAIKKVFKFYTISVSIILYLASYFIFLYLLLFFSQELTFHQSFVLINILWLGILIRYKKTRLNLLTLTVAIAILNIFNSRFLDYFDKNLNLIGDAEFVFYPQAKQIFENSLYYSITNPIIEGYPQFISYIHALLYKIGFINNEVFEYYPQTTNVFFLLMILFFLELDISIHSKITFAVVYFSLIMNSEWLNYLFSSSLMSESIVSYFFIVILKSLLDHFNLDKQFSLILFTGGWMIFTKQFISTIILLLLFYLCFTKKSIKYYLIAFSPLLINEMAHRLHFKSVIKDHHFSQIDIIDTILDLLFFRDLEPNNLKIIFDNFLNDKPFSLVYFTALVFSIFQLILNKDKKENIIYLSILLVNTGLVLILYISAWRNMELESPIRYFLTLMGLYFLIIFKNDDSKAET